jgi:PhnB protein
MADRDPIERLNEALEAHALDGRAAPDREIRELVAVARRLRVMPREAFRARLRVQLKEKAMTSTTATAAIQLREGFHSITPYIIVPGAARFIEFVKQAFGAEEKLRVPTGDGSRIMHAEVRIGDSMIELSDGNEQYPARPASIHLYLPDTDSAYQRALAAGAASLHPVQEMPYGERSGSVKDPFGNHWYIATHHGASHIPEGLRTVNPYLHPVGADELIDFLKQAFEAEEVDVYREQAGGPIRHATIRLGDTILEMSEARGQYGPMPTGLHLYVPGVDAAYARALKAGATSISRPADQPYGERGAGVRDPAGNSWFLATPLPVRE